jgi:hypothetical protein
MKKHVSFCPPCCSHFVKNEELYIFFSSIYLSLSRNRQVIFFNYLEFAAISFRIAKVFVVINKCPIQ